MTLTPDQAYEIFRVLLSMLFALCLVAALPSFVINHLRRDVSTLEWFSEWLSGLSTEAMGAIITTILFGLVWGLLSEELNTRQEQQAMLRDWAFELSSPVEWISGEAWRKAQTYGWLSDGTLSGADFSSLSLEGYNFSHADLSYVNLNSANLQNADLTGAILDYTDLRGANLQGANLRGAGVWQINIDGTTILPDGTLWRSGYDLDRFANS